MRIIRDIYKPCNIEKTVVALGNFDGIHKGHQELIKQTIKLAEKLNATPVLFTFYPHPIKIIKNIEEPFLIQTFKEKAKIVESLGIETIVCARFSKEFAGMQPELFIKEILLKNLNAIGICVGHDYTFGKEGKGNTKLLKELAAKYNFEVIVIPPVKIDGIIVSSTKIREFLRNGEIEKANLFLGRRYSISGIVKEGNKRGTNLGFPTANIYPHNDIMLPNGVYATFVYIDSKKFKAAVNVGVNPTFKGKIKHIEAHIFDFYNNIYGKKIKIEFVKFIREEKRFKKIDDLINRIKEDIKIIKSVLGEKDGF